MSIRNIISTLLLCWFCQTGYAQKTLPESLPIRFATKAEAEKLLTATDDFSKGLNQFDMDLRLQHSKGCKSEWLQLVRNETREWTSEEKQKITLAFQTVRNNILKKKMQMPCPNEIILVKTTMNEELKAGGYTRRNWIAIGQRELEKAPQSFLNELVGHELFHVLSRHDPSFKEKIYNIIGFKTVGHEILFPKDLMEKRISNPDIARRDSYITLNIHGKNTKCAEFIYTTCPFTQGNVMDYLTVGFIPLDVKDNPIVKDGNTIIYSFKEVQKEFKSKVGQNTDYIIDPEEISADNFSYLVTGKSTLSTPEIIEAMQNCLQRSL